MEIDPKMLWNLLLTFGIAPLYWFIKRMANEIDALERRLQKHQIDSLNRYVGKDDYRRDIDELKAMLSDIFKILRDKNGKN